MLKLKTSGAAIVMLLTLGCTEGKFKEANGSSSLLPRDSEDLTEETVDIPVISQSEELSTGSTDIEKNPLFAECANEPDRMIVADLYQLAPDTQKLPDYTLLKSIKKICLSQLDIKVRTFSEGFPGVANLFEWFSLDANFIVKVPLDGVYEVKLIADDGANLYIADQKVIDNDGIHPVEEKSGTANLKTGDVNFRVSYFQGPRFDIALELMWKGPNDTEFTYIPKAYFKRPVK
jgi:hypothetical protein